MSAIEQIVDGARPQTDEQTRARYPDEEGYVERDGVRVFYEVYGEGEPTILFLPTWTLVHSRIWKTQIPYLARHFRVVVFDPRGNGKSDRPTHARGLRRVGVRAGRPRRHGRDRAPSARSSVALSRGAQRTLLLAAEHPERVIGAVFIGPWFPASRSLGGLRCRVMAHPRLRPLLMRQPLVAKGWAKFNAATCAAALPGLRRVVRRARARNEPHSTKGFDDAVEWGLETIAETLILLDAGRRGGSRDAARPACARPRASAAPCSSSTAPRTA